jgi:hypothetical protein
VLRPSFNGTNYAYNERKLVGNTSAGQVQV